MSAEAALEEKRKEHEKMVATVKGVESKLVASENENQWLKDEVA